MSRVAISETVINWAIERSDLSLSFLREKFPNIEQWISGAQQPTLKQLERLAKTTLTPFGYFFLDEPPEEHLPIPNYRTLDDGSPERPSPDLLDTIHLMQQRQSWMRDHLIEQGQERLSIVASTQVSENVAVIAQRIRLALNLEEEWAARLPSWTDALRYLRNAMEDAGVLVVTNGVVGNNTHRKLNPEEFRGFVLVDDYAPLAFINGADGKAAQMFTTAHELAHVFFGSSASFDLREMQPASDPIEQKCNEVAAEVLVSARALRDLWPAAQEDEEPFQKIARHFKVSVLVAARRALDLALINRSSFLQFYNDYISDERRAARLRSGGGDFYTNQRLRVGRRFGHAVARAVKEGRLLYSDAYHLTGLYGRTFDSYISSIESGS